MKSGRLPGLVAVTLGVSLGSVATFTNLSLFQKAEEAPEWFFHSNQGSNR
jgi:hypothetical protein